MSTIDPIYKKLAAKMNEPKNRTLPKLISKIADLEQARITNELPNTADNVAKKLGLNKTKVEKQLKYLYDRGLVMKGKTAWVMVNNKFMFKDQVATANDKYDDDEVFDLAREMIIEDDKSLARRIKRGDKIPPVMKVMRVVPKWRSIKDIPGILPCEDAREIFKNASPIVVHKCPCRTVHRNIGCKDKVPIEICLGTNAMGQMFLERGSGKKLTYDEVMALLKEVDKFPVVSLTGNSNSIPEILCSCCTDCCALL